MSKIARNIFKNRPKCLETILRDKSEVSHILKILQPGINSFFTNFTGLLLTKTPCKIDEENLSENFCYMEEAESQLVESTKTTTTILLANNKP